MLFVVSDAPPVIMVAQEPFRSLMMRDIIILSALRLGATLFELHPRDLNESLYSEIE